MLSFVLVLTSAGCGVKNDTGTSSGAAASATSSANASTSNASTSNASSATASANADNLEASSATASANADNLVASSANTAASGGTGVISADLIFPLTVNGIEIKTLKASTVKELLDDIPNSVFEGSGDPIAPGIEKDALYISSSTSYGDIFSLTAINKTQKGQKPENCAVEALQPFGDTEFSSGITLKNNGDSSSNTTLDEVLKIFGDPKEMKFPNSYSPTWAIGDGGATITFIFKNDQHTSDNCITACIFNNLDELN